MYHCKNNKQCLLLPFYHFHISYSHAVFELVTTVERVQAGSQYDTDASIYSIASVRMMLE